jgi:hypothetical protein
MKHELLSLCVMIFACSAFAAHAYDPAAVERRVVSRGHVDIEVLSQAAGPVIVLLPSLGRSGEDYEAVAAMLASQGFRVVRPQPRGIGRSKGAMDGLNMHDLAADVASVVESENKGSVVVVIILSPGSSPPTGPIWCGAWWSRRPLPARSLRARRKSRSAPKYARRSTVPLICRFLNRNA